MPATLSALPTGVAVAIAALTGLVIGSFLNVVVYRTPRRLSVSRPPSFCPSCGAPVRPRDNIPVVSWIVLGGRCRDCRAPISARYPLVEAGTGALFAGVTALGGAHWAVPGLCVVFATLGAAAVIELDGQHVPAGAMAVGTTLGAAALVAAGVADRAWAHLAGMAAGLGAGVFIGGAALLLASGMRRRGDAPEMAPMIGVLVRSRVVLPVAGLVVGWTGGLASGIGAAVAVAGACVVSATRQRYRLAGAVVLLLAACAALVTAAASGTVPGR